MNTSFDYYKVFYYAASSGSITLAAQKLFLSQPTVSRCNSKSGTRFRMYPVYPYQKGNPADAGRGDALPAHFQSLSAHFCGRK